MKIGFFLPSRVRSKLLIGFLSLFLIQCECEPFPDSDEQTIPQQQLLTEITNEMIQVAENAQKPFLAQQLTKLQKEDRTKTSIPYINDTSSDTEGTALHSAVDGHFNKPNIVKALLERRADPNQLWYDQTPLFKATSYNPDHNLETIKLLLDAGADPLKS